jgi:hypothetical protein
LPQNGNIQVQLLAFPASFCIHSAYRSEDMEMYQITMPKDDAWYIMNELGGLGTVHFLDLNKGEQTHHLPYANQIRRCDETLKRLL